MSKSVVASLTLAALAVAAGTVAGNFRVSLIDSNGNSVSTVETADTNVTFAAVAAGDYTVSAARLDSAGNVLGTAAVSDKFTVPADAAPATINVDVPSTVTVSLA